MALDHLGRFDFHFVSDCWLNGCGVDGRLDVEVGPQRELEVPMLVQYGLHFDWVDVESDAIVGRSKMVQSVYLNDFALVHGRP